MNEARKLASNMPLRRSRIIALKDRAINLGLLLEEESPHKFGEATFFRTSDTPETVEVQFQIHTRECTLKYKYLDGLQLTAPICWEYGETRETIHKIAVFNFEQIRSSNQRKGDVLTLHIHRENLESPIVEYHLSHPNYKIEVESGTNSDRIIFKAK